MLLLSVILSATLNFTYIEEPCTKIVWHWEDDFTPGEQRMVEEWLGSVMGAVEETLGVYPFDVHFFIYRRDGSREPVPWASTRRNSVQGVDFHIDPSYDRDQDFVTVANDLQCNNRYPDMYWGGASYFMQIDQGLAYEYGQTFPGFIHNYLLCCRLKEEAFEELIESWDHLLGEPIFSVLLHIYQSAPASEILK